MVYNPVSPPTHSQGVYAFRSKWERLFLSKKDKIFLQPINAFFANISLYAISSYHQDRSANNTSIYVPLSRAQTFTIPPPCTAKDQHAESFPVLAENLLFKLGLMKIMLVKRWIQNECWNFIYVRHFLETHSIQPVLFVIRGSHHITRRDVIIACESCSPVTCTVSCAPCEVAFSRNHCIPALIIMTTE